MLSRILPLLCVGTLAWASGTAAWTDEKVLEPAQTWKGSVEDQELLGKPPAVIAASEKWQALWKGWKLAGEVPEVDFGKHLVVVQTTVGSQLRVTVKLTDEGDLKVLGLATRDLRPGFRYVLTVIAREGVKSVNGEKLPDAK